MAEGHMMDYAVPLAYGFENVDELLEAFEAEKPFPLNVKSIVRGNMFGRTDTTDEEIARVMTHAVALYWATGESATIWECLSVAWVFERG